MKVSTGSTANKCIACFLMLGLASACSDRSGTQSPVAQTLPKDNAPATAQASDASIPHGPPGRADDKLYAFSGNWAVDNIVVGIVAKGVIPFTPEYEAIRAGLEDLGRQDALRDGNEPKCIPNGPIMGMKFSFEVFATENRLTMNVSRFTRYVDVGKKHTPADELIETFAGESVAHWEGDTLVIDTTGLSATNEIDVGIHNSGKLHLIERWRILPNGKLEIRWTVEDPGALTQPWNFTVTYSRRPLPAAIEVNYCVPALDRARDKETGKQGFDLTPPDGGYVPPGAIE